MHELAIAEGLVEIVCDHAAGRRVTRVDVKLGHLRQVVPSALELGFQLVADGTVVEGAALEIEEIPVEAVCQACAAHARQVDFPFACPGCGSFELEIVKGEELLVDCLEVTDEVAA